MLGMRLLGAALMLLGCSQTKHDQAGAPRLAEIVQVSGTVDVLHAGTVDWARVGAGTPLHEDDRLRTFRGAWAQLAFVGGSTLRVEEESLISLGGGVLVERGVVQGELAAGLSLRTPSLEAESVPPRDIVFR